MGEFGNHMRNAKSGGDTGDNTGTRLNASCQAMGKRTTEKISESQTGIKHKTSITLVTCSREESRCLSKVEQARSSPVDGSFISC